MGEQVSAPERDAGVDQTKEHGGAYQPKARHQKNGKEKRGAERAQIIEREHVGDHVAKLVAVANNAHEQRNFQTHENAHDDDEGIENQFESLCECEGHHQESGRNTSNDTKHQLDPDKTMDEAAIDVAGERAADAHREKIRANDGLELKNAVTHQVARERARDELIDEPARRNQQHRDEEQNSHVSVNGGGNDDADPDGHGSDEDRQRHVVLLHDFLPQMVWGELVHHQKRDDEDQHAEKGKCQCSDDIAERNKVHLICLRCSDDRNRKRNDRSLDYHERTWEHFSTG